MRILFISATPFEIAPLLDDLNIDINNQLFSPHTYKTHTIDVLITGVGAAQTSFYLGKYLSNDYDLAINVGICGSFFRTINIGELVLINEDCFADLGAEDDEQFLSVEELKLPGTYFVKNRNSFQHPYISTLKQAKGATVNTTHGNAQSIGNFLKRSNFEIESMEGAAFLFACNESNVPCLQIRSISNYVEKRDRSKWDIPLAIKNLNDFLSEFTKLILP